MSMDSIMGRLKQLALIGLLLFTVTGVAAQVTSPPTVPLPTTLELTDVEVGLVRTTSGGCPGRCIHYRVTIRGNGAVTYEDLAQPPVPPRKRSVSVEEVVALLNEFVGARFFEGPERYVGRSAYVHRDGRLLLRGRIGADGPAWDLSLRLGGMSKAVHLYLDYPDYLGTLRDRVDRIGGPQAWAPQ
jgi:hypothetical protein